MIVAWTGHREERLLKRNSLIAIENRIYRWFDSVQPTRVIAGMAKGVDLMVCRVAHSLRVPCTAAVPWVGHSSNWSKRAQDEYIDLLEKCDRIQVTSDVADYEVSVYSTRNRWMVDNCQVLAAVWDGEKDGGTYDAIAYAEKIARPISFLKWDD